MQHFSKEQFHRLLQAAWDYRKRDWLMILLARNHGMRNSEVRQLKVDSFRDGYVTIQGLKRGLRGTQKLLENADPLYNEALGVFEFTRGMLGNQRLFPITRQRFWQIVQQHGATAGIEKHLCHPHACRHTTAMQMLGKAELPEIQRRLRHKNGASTLKYLNATDSQADAAYERSQKD